ncbi:hypothetical protein B0H13DRAFT_1611468, partial [Mycena leptocephala]
MLHVVHWQSLPIARVNASTTPTSTRGLRILQDDVATYRDLLLFEEQLKMTAAALQRRKLRYQLFLFQLLLITAFLLLEVLLPADVSLLAMLCQFALQRLLLRTNYIADTAVRIHPYLSTGMLLVSVTTLALFFLSGTYSDKIAYANKYVPHANRALRSFNMYFNVRKPPLRSKIRLSTLSSFFSRPAEEPPSPSGKSSVRSESSSNMRSGRRAIGSASSSVPILPIPPATNPRGELRFSSRVDRVFRENYERYRANFERKHAQQELTRAQTNSWFGRWQRGWRRSEVPAVPPVSAGISTSGAGCAPEDRSRSATPPVSLPEKAR